MKRTKISEILSSEKADYEVVVKGWVRSFRNNQFIALNDGSCMSNLQIVIDLDTDAEVVKHITTGAALSVEGLLIPSQGKGQKYEVKAKSIEVLGDCDAEKYPLQLKNRPSLEYLREIAHLRFRTNTFGAVFRVRHSLAFAIHEFFNKKGFVYLHTPIVTASDAEGAGEMFRVTTLPFDNPPRLEDRSIDFKEDFFWEKHQPYCKRTIGSRTGSHGVWRGLYIRTSIPCRKFKHHTPPSRVLDDRTGSSVQ